MRELKWCRACGNLRVELKAVRTCQLCGSRTRRLTVCEVRQIKAFGFPKAIENFRAADQAN